MILKNFELEKIKNSKSKFFLFYGENDGLKKQLINNAFLEDNNALVSKYNEKEVLSNSDEILSGILNQSFFEKNRILIVSDVSDNSLQFIEEILERNINDVKIILDSGILDKKSKIRNFFEKNKTIVCVPFYSDEEKTLSSIAKKFFLEKKISINQEIINLIVTRCNGNRGSLFNELNKIYLFSNGEKISIDQVLNLTNLNENFTISKLVDNCLAKNLKNITKIINENNYNSDDCLLILRSFLSKAKRLMHLRYKLDENENIEQVIESSKPPIFWKDKDIVRKQIILWDKKTIHELIINISKVEYLVKINSENSLNIVYDFIINTSK